MRPRLGALERSEQCVARRSCENFGQNHFAEKVSQVCRSSKASKLHQLDYSIAQQLHRDSHLNFSMVACKIFLSVCLFEHLKSS